jgi:3-isopropylmalate dehydrogenase
VYQIAVMEGDGIGPEIVRSTVKVLRAVETKMDVRLFDLIPLPIGLQSYEESGTTYPAETERRLRECDGAILGPVTTHLYHSAHMPNPSARIRIDFDLYANLRPVRSVPGVSNKFPNVDLLIARENTEGMYADRNMYNSPGEFMTDPDTVLSFRLVTRKNCERIAKMAFDMARVRNAKKNVSAIHKANVLKKGCGMFLDMCRTVSKEYPDIAWEDFHIDAFAMNLILHPEKYDVIVTTNMFGDILSDQAAGLVGTLGLAPGLNVGDQFAVAQASHGSSPAIAGKNIANPIAEILSAHMLIDWLGRRKEDDRLLAASALLHEAVWTVLEAGKVRTADMGGRSTTEEMCQAIMAEIYQR